MLPTADNETFVKLQTFYDDLAKIERERNTRHKTAKRRQSAIQGSTSENSWECQTCAAKGLAKSMPLTAEKCYTCPQKRPKELRAIAEAYKHSDEGQAAKVAKRGRKKGYKGWSTIRS